MNKSFFTNYESYKEKSLAFRRFKHSDILKLINKHRENSLYSIEEIGQSVESRSIELIKFGKGKTNVLLWSQMHGNEPTATAAIFDLLNFFAMNQSDETKAILENLTLHFIPMLNPDGAERFTRRNAVDIDLNRDAEALQMPETQALFAYMQKVKPQVGFNLHDQATKYAVGSTSKEATISLLAPEMDAAGSIPANRKLAMQLITEMNLHLQDIAKGHVARYDDSFTPRCVGDQFQKAGIATILVESGASRGDLERQFTRKLNFSLLLNTFQSLVSNSYENFSTEDYFEIPVNKERMFDILIRNAKVNLAGREARIDLGFRNNEITNDRDFSVQTILEDMGDLKTYHGLEELDATELKIEILADSSYKIDTECKIEIRQNNEIIRIENGKLQRAGA